MESRRSRNVCHCPRSTLRFSSTLLFLSWILPTPSFAQLTTSPSSTHTATPTTLSITTLPSSTHTATPTTFSTSTLPSSSSDQSLTPTPQPPPPSTPTTTPDEIGAHAFNYYFVIIAFVAVLFCLCMLWLGRRRKRKAALMRRQSQRALAQDVEGWRTRFGTGARREDGRVEGLDERGEAPPPYAPGGKPPSIRTEDGRGSEEAGVGNGEAVQLRRLSGEVGNLPPGYHETAAVHRGQEEDIGDITRPRAAVMASERFASMRRLLSDRSSSQA